MSRIYFHTPSDTAELRGNERAYMNLTTARLARAVFAAGEYGADELLGQMVPPTHYAHGRKGSEFASAFDTLLVVPDRTRLLIPGGERSADVSTVCLNTALALGGDVVRLMARLHGQCEIHAWVDGPNRTWLADIIAEGRRSCVLRAEMGWEEVEALLRRTDTEPVVTSYSVCDSFPNAYVAEYTDDSDGDTFWDLPEAERWDRAMQRLRAAERHTYGLELRPDQWCYPDGFYFGPGPSPDSAFSLLEAAWQTREAAPAHG